MRSSGDEAMEDIPFELVGEVASACSVAEAGDVERSAAAARHGCNLAGDRVYSKLWRTRRLMRVVGEAVVGD